jgi:ubiquitin
LIFEVGQPTVLKDGTVAGLSFNFESSIVIKKLEQGRVSVAGSDGEEIQTFPSGKRVAGSGINPYSVFLCVLCGKGLVLFLVTITVYPITAVANY